jgi:hypothetical protein
MATLLSDEEQQSEPYHVNGRLTHIPQISKELWSELGDHKDVRFLIWVGSDRHPNRPSLFEFMD